ncbi:hypothetical protein ACFQY7_05440 [Actinomadura luteofluorescens]|uniref:hypothetical protein n=1 Tax=Actinomadura luteofluorescens TaxID=46163 RepID=UPI00362D0B26
MTAGCRWRRSPTWSGTPEAEYCSPAHHKAGRKGDTAELAPTRKLGGEAARLVQLLVVSEERTGALTALLTGALTALLTGAVAATAEEAGQARLQAQRPSAPSRPPRRRPPRNGIYARSPSGRPPTPNGSAPMLRGSARGRRAGSRRPAAVRAPAEAATAALTHRRPETNSEDHVSSLPHSAPFPSSSTGRTRPGRARWPLAAGPTVSTSTWRGCVGRPVASTGRSPWR